MTSSCKGIALAALTLAALAACSDPSADANTEVADGSLRGNLVAYVATFDDGTSETQYFLRRSDNDELRLAFDVEPEVSPGTLVKIWGEQGPDALHVARIEPVTASSSSGGIASESEALVGATPKPSRRMGVFLVDIGGGLGTLTADVVGQAFFDGPKAAKAYYEEVSYGITGLDGDVLGPFSYPMTTCDTKGMSTAMRAMTTATYDQFAYVFKKTSACAWSGLGSVGEPTKPSRDTWYNGAVSCVVVVQEPGHNFGMQHSSSMACPNATFADDPNTCTHSEYGDKFDPMGGGCRHMNMWQKNYEGWFGGCNNVKVTSSGTYNLLPAEVPCDGIQGLQIPMPKTRSFTRPAGGGSSTGVDTLTSYYLEYRVSSGFDSGMTPTVLLHVTGDYRPPTKIGLHTWLLDMHPTGSGGVNDAGFKAGETFTDPAGGVSITVTSMDADKAVVDVQITNGTGGPTCLDGTALTAPGPTACGSPTVPDAGTGGAAGASSTDAGGTGGASGAAGASADAGNAGASGASGSDGAAGTNDLGGAGGSGASSGSGGNSGANAGTAGSAGSGASSNPGTDAGAYTPGHASNPAQLRNSDQTPSNCSCEVPGAPSRGRTEGAALMVGLAGVLAARRRKNRARFGALA